MTETEAKEKFARLLLKEPGDPFVIALKLYPDDVKFAARIAVEWPRDPEVLAKRAELGMSVDENSFLPTKAQLARDTWELMHDKYTDPAAFARLGKLYAELMGYIEKPKVDVTTNVQQITNRVMIVRESVSDAEWERKLLAQQSGMLNA